jgi:hypothetical protein
VKSLLRTTADKDGMIAPTEGADPRLKQKVYFEAFDLDRDGKLNAREWDIYRAMMAAENGHSSQSNSAARAI